MYKRSLISLSYCNFPSLPSPHLLETAILVNHASHALRCYSELPVCHLVLLKTMGSCRGAGLGQRFPGLTPHTVALSRKITAELGMVAHGFHPRLRKQIQEDVYAFQARLVYTVNLRPA